MSRNFTTDVDTQREYFNATYFNNSGQNQIAKYDTTLLKPFFPNPDQWKLAINRMRVPLSGIPLTKNNIPFQQWTVGIDYRPVASGTGGYTSVYDVKQYNQTEKQQYLTYSITNTLGVEVYELTTTTSTLLYTYPSVQGGTTTNNTGRFVKPILSPDGKVMACLNSSDTLKVNVYTTIDSSLLGTIDCTSLCTQITALMVDKDLNVYIGIVNSSNIANILSFNFSVQSQSYTQSITYTPPNANNWFLITSMTYNIASPNQIFLSLLMSQSSQPNIAILAICGINFGTALMVFTAVLQYFGNLPTYNPQVLFNGSSFFVSDWNNILNQYEIFQKDGNNDLQAFYTTGIPAYPPPNLLGLTQTGNLVINGTYSGYTGIQIMNPPSNSASSLFFNPPNGCLCLQPIASPQTIQVPGGPYDIFTYQGYLNKINEAFQNCFNDIKAQKGASFLPTEPPSIIYNPQTRLFNLIVEGQYLTTNADGSNQYTIFMNDALWDKFYFPSSGKFQTIYNAIILQNYGINAIVGTGSNTLPQFIYVQQEDSTIYAFYDLVRIIVGTTLIPVSGDGEGKTFSNTGFSSNNAINMITDIVPDTTTLTPGSVIIYIPAGILRWYNLYAQQPFQRVDLILFYETKDGNVYPIEITNGEFFSVKLEFKKGPGDF